MSCHVEKKTPREGSAALIATGRPSPPTPSAGSSISVIFFDSEGQVPSSHGLGDAMYLASYK